MILLGIILFLTVLEAVHEGLRLRSNHVELDWKLDKERTALKALKITQWAGIIEMVKLTGLVVIILFLIKTDKFDGYIDMFDKTLYWGSLVPRLIIGWSFIRYAIFDYIHNICAGIPVDYIGKTKLYDQFWRWALRNQYIPAVHLWSRLVFILVGLSLVLKI